MAAAILGRVNPTTAATRRVAPLTLARAFSSDSTSLPLTVDTSLPFASHNVDPPSRSVATTPSELLATFRSMALMRRSDIASDCLYKAKKLIRGFCHLYDGQEAVAVGMEAGITRRDAIITAYREHCLHLARGGSLVAAFAELLSRVDGCSRGKGDSMHFYKKDAGFYGVHGMVGEQVPLGCGIASAQRYRKEGSNSNVGDERNGGIGSFGCRGGLWLVSREFNPFVDLSSS